MTPTAQLGQPDLTALLIPGTPLLLAGIDPEEPAVIADLRRAAQSALPDRVTLLTTGTPEVPLAALPEVMGFGGLGIDRGVRLTWCCSDNSETSEDSDSAAQLALLEAEEYRQAITGLSADDTRAAQALPVATITAVMFAAAVGAQLLLGRQPHPGAPALVPVDFSAAARPDAPLAPTPGARELDAQIEATIASGTAAEVGRLPCLLAAAAAHATDHSHLRALAAAVPCWRAELRAATDVHRVRYRVYALFAREPL